MMEAAAMSEENPLLPLHSLPPPVMVNILAPVVTKAPTYVNVAHVPGLYRHSRSGRYYACKKLNGIRRECSLRTSDRKIAERRLKEWIGNMDKVDAEVEKTTLDQLIQRFLYPIAGRRAYSCVCGFQVYPTAGSIFHKSTTSLKTWCCAMYLMGHSRNGVAALELQRLIGTTYKTAWCMMHQIRALMAEALAPFKGTVEVDETYIGGQAKNMHKAQREERIQGRGPVGQTIVVAALEHHQNQSSPKTTRASSAFSKKISPT